MHSCIVIHNVWSLIYVHVGLLAMKFAINLLNHQARPRMMQHIM